MSDNEQIIVLVQDSGDASHGEISVVESWEKAEQLIETLLEAGFEGERIHVFKGRQSEFQISHRPVVSFGGGTAQGPAAKAPVAAQRPAVTATAPQAPKTEEKPPEPKAEAPEEEPAANPEPQAAAQAQPDEKPPQAEPKQSEDEGQPEAEEEPVEAGAVRFSSLFRSA